jgi:hypothetical protein
MLYGERVSENAVLGVKLWEDGDSVLGDIGQGWHGAGSGVRVWLAPCPYVDVREEDVLWWV